MIYIVLIANIVTIGAFVYFYSKRQKKQASSAPIVKTESKSQVIQKAEERADSLINKTQSIVETKEANLQEKSAELELLEVELEDREKNLEELREQAKRKDQSINDIQKHNVSLENELVESLTKIVGEDKQSLEGKIKQTLEDRINKFYGKLDKKLEFFANNNSEDNSFKQLDLILPNAYAELDIDLETNNTFVKFEDLNYLKKLSEDKKFIDLVKKETGVDLEFDLERREIVISSLDPVRREVVYRLVEDMINSKNRNNFDLAKSINQSKHELLDDVKRTGQEVCKMLGFDYLPDRLKVSIGKCKYRFSYGQNLLKHSVEMVHLGESIANLIGADVKTARLACFLHDIGKVEPEGEKPHHHISADMVKELYSDDEVLYNAIISHHFDVEALYPESFVVLLADSISGSRPGARRNSAEEYFERVNAMIDIANQNNFVRQSFVIKGGRELRILLDSNQTKDKDADNLAKKVAKEVEESLSYPGSVLVNVIRETVVTEKANKNLD